MVLFSLLLTVDSEAGEAGECHCVVGTYSPNVFVCFLPEIHSNDAEFQKTVFE